MNAPQLLWLEDDPELAVTSALSELQQDQVVLFPTDTVYGLLAHYASRVAYQQIFQIKQRATDKPLQLLTTPSSPVAEAVRAAIGQTHAMLVEFNAGRATIVLSPHLLPRLPSEISLIQPGPVGLRAAQLPVNIQVLSALNPYQLAWATSANQAAELPMATTAAVEHWLDQAQVRPACAVVSRYRLPGQASAVFRFTEPSSFQQLR